MNVISDQEGEDSQEKQTAEKKVLIEFSDVEDDDFDSKSQGESQSSNTNIRKLETFASSGVKRLDTT